MYLIIGRPKSIEDLEGKINPNFDIRKIREKQKLLLIDDEKNPKVDLLTKNGYYIQQLTDLDSLATVSNSTIILCDIKGVGIKLGGKDGGHLISEIKKTFPLKPVIAYSGQTYSPKYNKYFTLADKVINKDADLEEWLEELDQISKSTVDPINQWKLARRLLFERGLKNSIVLKLEDEFVNSYDNKNNLEKLSKEKWIEALNPEVKAIITDLIAHLIIRLTLG